MVRLELRHPPLNLLTIRMLGELERALEELEGETFKVLVVESRQKAFSAGAEVAEHLPGRFEEMLSAFHRALLRLLHFPRPTVAVVGGAALGGGLELALCCDFLVCSASARLGQPEIRLGVFPPLACVLLPRRIPERRARELILTGEPLDGRTAFALGLANRVAEEDELPAEVERLLSSLTGLSAEVLRLTKKALAAAPDLEEVERLYREELMAHPDALEGLRAFLERRAPRWQDA